jgi:FMN phosphatase YigB (HAD superfamily)
LIKNFLILLIREFFSFYYNYIFFNLLKYEKIKNNEVYIFDLDNTLADTWPTLKADFESEYDRILNIEPINNIVDIFNEFNFNNKDVYILSARSYDKYFVTKSWLKKNTNFRKFNRLILVPNVTDKLNILKKINRFYIKIYYYDDLSYNQENGETLFYRDVIEKVKNIVNKHYDLDYIQSLR